MGNNVNNPSQLPPCLADVLTPSLGYTGSFDGRTGIGMQMTAMEVIQTLLPTDGPVTYSQGISTSDPSAGSSTVGTLNSTGSSGIITVTTGDRAGAAILTILFGLSTLAGGWWIIK